MAFLVRWMLVNVLTTTGLMAAGLPDWKVRTGAGNEVGLVQLAAENTGTLFAVVAATNQDSGQEQLKILLSAHQALVEHTNTSTPVYHLNVIAGAPRLVQGFIRRGITGEYSAPVTNDMVLLAFPSSNDDFIAATGIEVDDIATWLWVDGSGNIRSAYKMIDTATPDAFIAWYVSQSRL